MIRIIFVVILFLIILYCINAFIPLFGSANRCHNCDGDGYWKGIRGEKNLCKTCNGTGES